MNINRRDGDSASILPKKMAIEMDNTSNSQCHGSMNERMAVKLITKAISSVMDQMPDEFDNTSD
jgi:hypothetical protein